MTNPLKLYWYPKSMKSIITNSRLAKDQKFFKETTHVLQRPLNTVVKGDCVQIIKNLSKDLKFDVIIADPPYNIGKNFGNNKDNLSLKEYIQWCQKWMGLCLNRLNTNGVLYVYGFPEILAHVATLFPIEKQKWLVWHYTNKTIPSLKFWQRSHETIICFWKDGRPALEVDQIREPYTAAYKKCVGRKRKNTPGRFGNRETVYRGHKNGALPRDVLKVSALAGGKGRVERSPLKHPTQKPFELTKKLLHSRINEQGGKVLIPFCGSGSECVLAKSLNMDFLGIEINPDYVESAKKWLSHS